MSARQKLFASVLMLGIFSAAAFAQTGTIKGTVTDPKDAVVQGATITLRNTATGAVRAVESGSSGVFTATNLPAGIYDVSIAKDTFKTALVPAVVLTVDQVQSINAKLEVGAASERIEVSGDASPIDLETSQVSNVVDSRRTLDLPLILRDPYQLVLLSPGITQSNSGLGGFSSNGSSERNNNFLLDGQDNNDTSVPGLPTGLVGANPDSMEEFRVITNNYLPEFGRNDGAIIDVVSKSGTNQLHGDAYWFGRYNALGARDYFNHHIDQNTGKIEKKNPYVRNLFGFSVGGPIQKDKTFFFFNDEIQRFRTTLTPPAVTVPTAAFKSGLFTYTDANGAHAIDLTTPGSPNNAQGFALDATTANILKLYPNPNGALSSDGLTGSLFFPSKSAADGYTLTAKIDHNFTSNETLSVRGSYGKAQDPDPSHDEFLPGLGATGTRDHVYQFGLNLTSTLRSNLVNEAKFGFNRNDNPFYCGGLSGIDAISGKDSLGNGRDFLVPAGVTGFGCLPLGDSNGQGRRTGTWSGAEQLSWVQGSHAFKFGAEYRRIYELGADNFGSRDQLSFSGYSAGQPPAAFVNINPGPLTRCDPNNIILANCGTSQLQDFADFLFGAASSEGQSQFFDKNGTRTATDNRSFRQNEYGFYAQDSWKIRSNLTVNYGMRYQFNGVPYEIHNNLSNLYVDPSGAAPFTFQLAGPGTGRLLYNNDTKNFEPRVGFAWDPFRDGKTSVRGGFGIFHDRVFGNLFGNVRGNPPFNGTFGSNPNLQTPENLPFPSAVPVSPIVQNGSITGFTVQPTLIDPNLRMPYTEGWNFGIQREVMKDLTVDVSYVAKKGVHGLRVVDGNPPDPLLVQQLIATGALPPDQLQFSILYFGQEFGLTPFDAVHNNAFATVNGAGGGAGLTRSIGNSNYNSLQLNVTRRFAKGFQIQGAYTYSHAIADYGDVLNAAAGNRNFPRNTHAIANERGNSDFDIRQRFVMNYIYELPFGRGKGHLNSGLVGRALEGWQLSGISSFQKGHPYDVFFNQDVEHTGVSGRATIIGSTRIPAGSAKTQTGPLASAFCTIASGPGACIPFGVPGNSGRNHFTGPGINRWDMVLAKNTSITEKVKLEFRFEGYNVFNHAEFAQPDNLLQDTGTFGTSTATLTENDGTTSARQLQFGLKLKF